MRWERGDGVPAGCLRVAMIAGHAQEGRVGRVVESIGRLGAKASDPEVALSLTHAADAVGQVMQGDGVNGDNAVRSRPARRAVVAMRAL